MSIPYDNLDFGPVMLTFSFKPGQSLPKVGEVIEDERCSMVVTESNKEHNYIKVLLNTVETVASRMERYKIEIDICMEDVAEMLYTHTTEGMISLIGWNNLTEETKEPYRKLAKTIFLKIDKDDLFILKYEDNLT